MASVVLSSIVKIGWWLYEKMIIYPLKSSYSTMVRGMEKWSWSPP